MYRGLSPRRIAAGFVLVALLAAFSALATPRIVLAEHPDCEVHALGELSADADTPLTASGRWTAEDCDSRFRASSDVYTHSFEVVEAAGSGSTSRPPRPTPSST